MPRATSISNSNTNPNSTQDSISTISPANRPGHRGLLDGGVSIPTAAKQLAAIEATDTDLEDLPS